MIFLVLNSLRFILWPRILLSWWRCPKLVKRICILLYWWSSLKKSRWLVVMCTPSPCPLLCPRHTPGQRTGVHSWTHSSLCSFSALTAFALGILMLCYQTFEQRGRLLDHLDKFLYHYEMPLFVCPITPFSKVDFVGYWYRPSSCLFSPFIHKSLVFALKKDKDRH